MLTRNTPWTKFICTLGPASGNAEVMEELAKAGATMFRNNFAHCPYDEYRERKAILDDINRRLGTNVKMQADLQGPNIRLGDEFENDAYRFEEGKDYTFYTLAAESHEPGELFINDQTLHLDVKAGEPITFMDGAVEGEVLEVNGAKINVRMLNSGTIRSRVSINVPETNLSQSAITDKDRRDLEFLMEAGVDYVALSFISTGAEVEEARSIIGDHPVKIISKIERRTALQNIHEILLASDAIMIARGDLGIELPLEEIPVIQKALISLCEHHDKPVIMATQMLVSMVRSHRPTRAEVSDVAQAVFDRCDALMLSEETAKGQDPVNALSTMVKIARRAEDYMYNRPNLFDVLESKR